jgi:hypothetical protein
MNRKTVLALAASASFGATPTMILGQGVRQTEAIASSDVLSQISMYSYRQGPKSGRVTSRNADRVYDAG